MTRASSGARASTRRFAVLVAAGALVAACGGTTAREQGFVREPPRGVAVAGPRVEQGTEFFVEMVDPIGTQVSEPGDAFVAHTVAPIRMTNGELIVSAGSVVRGHVLRVDRAPSPKLEIAFDTIETKWGPIPVQATVLQAERYATVGSAPPRATHDAVLLPPIGPGAAIGGGPPTGGHASPTPQVLVPKAAQLKMMLTAPLEPIDQR